MTLASIKTYIKGAIRSWTLHFNVWVMAVFTALPSLQDWFPSLQNYLPSKPFQYGMVILAVGNFVLRFKTNQSIPAKAPPAPPAA